VFSQKKFKFCVQAYHPPLGHIASILSGGAPASPDGDVFFPNNIPTGSKNTPIISLNGRNLIGDRGSGPHCHPYLRPGVSGVNPETPGSLETLG
jgi:hypothetical protein